MQTRRLVINCSSQFSSHISDVASVGAQFWLKLLHGLKFGTDIQGAQRMTMTNPLTVHLLPPAEPVYTTLWPIITSSQLLEFKDRIWTYALFIYLFNCLVLYNEHYNLTELLV